MIRLAAIGDETIWQPSQRRMRGATLTICHDSDHLARVSPSVDAVVLMECGPPAMELTQRCLTARQHVCLAVESWLTRPRLESLTTLAREAQVGLSLVNPVQFLPSRQLIRQRVSERKLGDPGLVRNHRWEPAATESRIAETASFGDLVPTALLRDLDVVLSLTHIAPNAVFALERQHDQGRFLHVHLGFADGAMALVDYTDRLPGGDSYQSVSVIGSRGAAYSDDLHNQQLLFQKDRATAIRMEERGSQLAAIVQHFVDRLAAGDDGLASVQGWERVLAVAKGVEKSLATGMTASLEGL